MSKQRKFGTKVLSLLLSVLMIVYTEASLMNIMRIGIVVHK